LAGGALGLSGSGSKMDKFRSFIGKLKKVNSMMRKHKVLSRAGSMYGKTSLPYAKNVGKAGEVAGKFGYGRRRRRRR
jgi:hypothetical protein